MSGVRAGLAALLIAAAGQARAEAPVDAVEAVYLAKFAPFVEWPASAFPTATSTFRLCILGGDPFGAVLDQAVRGQQVATHPVEVRRLPSAEGVGDCHILYFRSPRPADLSAALAQLKGLPVLVVTDGASTPPGGAIRFVVRGGRVRFVIDAAAAAATGVHISSKLLSLAVEPGR